MKLQERPVVRPHNGRLFKPVAETVAKPDCHKSRRPCNIESPSFDKSPNLCLIFAQFANPRDRIVKIEHAADGSEALVIFHGRNADSEIRDGIPDRAVQGQGSAKGTQVHPQCIACQGRQ